MPLPDEPKAGTTNKFILPVKPGDRVTVTLPGGKMDGDYVVGEDGVTLFRTTARTI